MNARSTPGLSVVLPTDRLETAQATLAALRRQTAAQEIEVVLVTPTGVPIAAPDPEGDFAGVRLAECAGFELPNWLSSARAVGVRSATAPVVVIGETHSFPEPGWAEALLAAHREPWAAVGVAMLNANPGSVISWANLLVDFGPWVERRERGPMLELPGHNTSYKRAVLLARGARLERDLASETLLAESLRAEGHTLLFEPAAATRHLNLATPYFFIERFDHDRAWAVLRAAEWSVPKRMLYVIGAPLIPLVRFARLWRELRRVGRGGDLWLVATILLGLAAGAAGEAVAYILRRADASNRRMHDVELHRRRYTEHLEAAL